ncbi:hypothetical protein M9H77_23928 [Catharanthus roseus]|uniref:Uncharacterized protein n=1 Tax=Catharanthus roseus TaxID=4058 RepID=A0ACC0AW75_CATRO|nr:hypothetical protein M9H77_23928 [Catharanthus roseus]
MGQKINPLGFRLGITQDHHSLWFAQPKKYFEGLQEDQKIRDCIKNYIQKNMKISSAVEGIALIVIQKRIDLIQVIIFMGFLKFLLEYITIKRIAKPYGNPNLFAEFIAKQLKNRVSFRKAMKKAIELTEQAMKKDSSTNRKEGRVPLQTIQAKIDYCSYTVQTIHGVLGIKIWIFLDEE